MNGCVGVYARVSYKCMVFFVVAVSGWASAKFLGLLRMDGKFIYFGGLVEMCVVYVCK